MATAPPNDACLRLAHGTALGAACVARSPARHEEQMLFLFRAT
jgi:hypothetical protein